MVTFVVLLLPLQLVGSRTVSRVSRISGVMVWVRAIVMVRFSSSHMVGIRLPDVESLAFYVRFPTCRRSLQLMPV